MFEEYLQDSYEFLMEAENEVKKSNERNARRYFRASVFYTSGAIEAFVNYIVDSLTKAGNIKPHEITFLNDKTWVFSGGKGLRERTEFHKLDDKLRLLIYQFVPDFDFKSLTWFKFKEFKKLRDSLVHPRQIEDETTSQDYQNKVRTGLKAIIELMNTISEGMFQRPLRQKLLDLIPE